MATDGSVTMHILSGYGDFKSLSDANIPGLVHFELAVRTYWHRPRGWDTIAAMAYEFILYGYEVYMNGTFNLFITLNLKC